jgi:hypothetical protein
VENYEARFKTLTAGKAWEIRRIEFPNELVFVVQKG